jgi:hypothetical protein
LEESAIAHAKGSQPAALDKAKEAAKRERKLTKFRDANNMTELQNTDLTYPFIFFFLFFFFFSPFFFLLIFFCLVFSLVCFFFLFFPFSFLFFSFPFLPSRASRESERCKKEILQTCCFFFFLFSFSFSFLLPFLFFSFISSDTLF